MPSNEVEDLEIDLFLEGIYRRYGYDFRNYERSTIRRRLRHRMAEEKARSISSLQEKMIRDPACMEAILKDLAVSATAFFRDPEIYELLRCRVIPYLRTFPSVRIWHAGCSSGEEVYSLALLLAEEGLISRCRLYGTDLNATLIETARKGVFEASLLAEGISKYNYSAPVDKPVSRFQRPLHRYANFSGRHVEFHSSLRDRLVFAVHNMATDESFQEFQLILCRNVILYFDNDLQTRTHELLYQSLRKLGYLALGSDESMHRSPRACCYQQVDPASKLYRKVA